jgi:PHD/YefM family antitoxin component YafN of YafNO toxin-antitoxin module
MSTSSVTDARGRLPELIALTRSEAVFLERRGEVAAVLISPERYAVMLEAIEEAEDVAAFDASMADEGDSIPWDQVKSDLGWV